jgi:hypothetical protein
MRIYYARDHWKIAEEDVQPTYTMQRIALGHLLSVSIERSEAAGARSYSLLLLRLAEQARILPKAHSVQLVFIRLIYYLTCRITVVSYLLDIAESDL